MIRSDTWLRRFVRLLILFVALFSGERSIFAADVLLTDTKGNRVEVHDVQLTYETRTEFGQFVRTQWGTFEQATSKVWQADGIKVLQGAGQVLIDWTRIQRISNFRLIESGSRLVGELTLRGDPSAERLSVEFVKPQDQLIGTLAIGRFSIPLENIATIEPMAAPAKKFADADMQLTNFTVTDRKGVAVMLKGTSVLETPWLALGAGSVTIPFERVSRIDVSSATNAGAAVMSVEVDGEGKYQLGFEPGSSELSGESNLGSYAIPWSQVVSIVCQRERVTKK